MRKANRKSNSTYTINSRLPKRADWGKTTPAQFAARQAKKPQSFDTTPTSGRHVPQTRTPSDNWDYTAIK